MKRVLAILLSIIFVFLLSGCNKSTVVSSTIEDYDFSSRIPAKPVVPEQPQAQSSSPSSKPTVNVKRPEFVDTTNQEFLNQSNDPTTLTFTEPAEPTTVINVKDYGAMGDGVTDDRLAFFKAFDAAAKSLPATLYIPEGEYMLHEGGMQIGLPLGSSGLTVKGDGADKSVIKYAEDWFTKGSWVAIRIMPESVPATTDQYLKNITVTDIGIYDTDPVKHSWDTKKGDKGTEETHGLDIQYCINAVVKNCKITSVGDEAIDMVYCIDSTIINNTVLNSPGAGKAGGAISVGDGSENILIMNNVVDGSIQGKSNFGIAIEALNFSTKNIQIKNNTVKNISGYAINIGAPNGTIQDVILYNNTISGCTKGINLSGKGTKNNIKIVKTDFSGVKQGIAIDGAQTDNLAIQNFKMTDISDRGIYIKTGKNISLSDGVMTNANNDAIWSAVANVSVKNIKIENSGMSGKSASAITQYAKSGTFTLENCILKNCQNKVAIKNVHNVINVSIEQPQTPGYNSVQGALNIKGGYFNRHITGLRSNAVIDGAKIDISENVGTTPAIYITVSGCTVKNCIVFMPSGKAISESENANSNRVTDNICDGGSVVKHGKNSVFQNNIVK